MTPDGLACSFERLSVEKVFEAHGLRTSMERSIEGRSPHCLRSGCLPVEIHGSMLIILQTYLKSAAPAIGQLH